MGLFVMHVVSSLHSRMNECHKYHILDLREEVHKPHSKYYVYLLQTLLRRNGLSPHFSHENYVFCTNEAIQILNLSRKISSVTTMVDDLDVHADIEKKTWPNGFFTSTESSW